jgi:uncharacterized iron-regulated protein
VDGVLDARTGRTIPFDGMVDALAGVPMVFVGESHTNPEHHEVQRRIVDALSARNPRLLVGLEMLQRPYQEVLDRWSAGEMGEAEFLREVQWYDQWQNWGQYAPILRLARDRRLRVVGLNVDWSVIREIGRKGLEGMDLGLRARIPADIDTSVKAHEKAIREILHPGPGADPEAAEARFRRTYEAQVTWDETMAESAVDALAAAPPGAAIVVLAGAMHVKGFLSIPERARRRNGRDYLVVLPLERDAIPEGGVPVGMGRPADFVVFTGPTPTGRGGVLGVALRSGDATVKQVSPGGAAAEAGLREGDLLLEVDGRTVADFVDLRLALEGLPPGRAVALRWRRGEEEMGATAALRDPSPRSSPHEAPKEAKPAAAPKGP